MTGQQLVVGLVLMLANAAVALAILGASIVLRSHLRANARPASLVACVLVGLALPIDILLALRLDIAKMVMVPVDPTASRTVFMAMQGIGVVVGGFYVLLQVPLVTHLADKGAGALPTVFGRPARGRGVATAAAAGAIAAAVGTVAFTALGVTSSAGVAQIQAVLPPVGSAAYFAVLVPSTIAAALREEILFRGVVQGWLGRILPSSRLGVVTACVLSSGFWAALHVGNTGNATAKLVQIFVLGLILSSLARRHSVEASMAGHAGHNLVGLFLSVGLKA